MMRWTRRTVAGALAFAALATATVVDGGAAERNRGSTEPSRIAPSPRRATELLGRLRAAYDANEGQFDERVKFVGRGGGVTALFTDDGATLVLRRPGPRPETAPGVETSPPPIGAAVRLRFGGAASAPEAGHLLPTVAHYFLGNDPARWRSNVRCFGEVRYRGVAPGIDLVWHGTRRALEYDLVVAPGADASAFRLDVDGIESLTVGSAGDLVARTAGGEELRQTRPVAWQEVDGVRRGVEARFRVEGTSARIEVGPHDPARRLVIDPQLEYASFFGGNSSDWGQSIAVDSAGAIYVAGSTTSTNFPLAGPYQSYFAGGTIASGNSGDLYVAKFTPNGAALAHSTYLGGSANEGLFGMDVFADGSVCLVGSSSSQDYPTLNAFQAFHGGGSAPPNGPYDFVVTKIGPTGAALGWSSYLGGNLNEVQGATALGADGAVYVSGITLSGNFPTVNPRQGFRNGTSDAFITKIAPSGTSLEWSTFHGGSKDETQAIGIAVDSSGACYVAGSTNSTDFPLNNPIQSTLATGTGGVYDLFVSKFNASGSALVYSTYLGGNRNEYAGAMALDSNGAAHLTGYTNSTDFPVLNAFQPNLAGNSNDAFVLAIVPTGSSLLFSTLLGGSSAESGYGIALDSTGAVYVCGATLSSDFPTVNPVQATKGSGASFGDAYVTKFPPGGGSPVYSTYLGGTRNDDARCIAVDAKANVYFCGPTDSTDFPVVAGYELDYGGGVSDTFVAKLAPNSPAAPINLVANLQGTSAALLTWNDVSSNETGFEIARWRGTGSVTIYGLTNANATSFVDASIFPNTEYGYLVRAVNAEGLSAWSNAAHVTSLGVGVTEIPPAPKSPVGLAVVVVAPTEVELHWADRSNDEAGFEITRAEGGRPFAILANAAEGATSRTDATVLPGWPYTYRVRALAPQGPSATYATAPPVATPATLSVATLKGSLTDTVALRKDKVSWSGTFAFADGSTAGAIDPVASGFEIQIGPADGALALAIPPAAAGWKVKKSKAVWKSAKGVVPKATLTIDTVKRTVAVTASAFDFGAAPVSIVRVLVAAGTQGGAHSAEWTVKRAGALKFP